ncbi:hypothetical protein BT69DRAFT_1297226 [Atractiella rhizophila]|nr:hypothetical protein BT69DRAFT_1297226 [Atractiella rhizophila]
MVLHNKPDLSDIIFTFPKDLWKPHEKLYANKAFLSSISPVFQAMFGPCFEESQGEIGKPFVSPVVDTSYRTFAALLRYIHTAQVQFRKVFSYESYCTEDETNGYQKSLENKDHFLTSYTQWNEDQTLSTDPETETCDPVELYVLAEKFDLQELKKIILDQLHQHLTPQSAYDALFSVPSLVFVELRKVIRNYVLQQWVPNFLLVAIV